MTRRSAPAIEVLVGETVAGTLMLIRRPGHHQDSLAFTYSTGWLQSPDAFELSPDLPLTSGQHSPRISRTIFSTFQDALPDAWGRRVMSTARPERSPLSTTRDIQLLLDIPDDIRQGALRFRLDGRFLGAPTRGEWIRDLPDLVAAADRLQEGEPVPEQDRRLLEAGTSAGGAQPKAWIRDGDSLWLAKFPPGVARWQGATTHDTGLWEAVTATLQRRAGIPTAEHRLQRLPDGRHVFLTRRFDRDGRRRLPYVSMHGAFELDPGQHLSYEAMALRAARLSASPDRAAQDMFDRAVFSVLTGNVDDHMRNFGFLWRGAWELSPHFDVTPDVRGNVSDTPLVTGGDPADRDLRQLWDHADAFRLSRPDAQAHTRAVADVVAGWADVAGRLGATDHEKRMMTRAFTGGEHERAADLPR